MLWGNGSYSDNRWVDSAFRAVGLEHLMKWKFYNNMCVRSVVAFVQNHSGKDWRRHWKMAPGTAHIALEDCKHQVRYLCAARKSVKSKPQSTNPNKRAVAELEVADVEELKEFREWKRLRGQKDLVDLTGEDQDPTRRGTGRAIYSRGLITPDTSFSMPTE